MANLRTNHHVELQIGAQGWLGRGTADRAGRDAATATATAAAVCSSMSIHIYIYIHIYYIIAKKVMYFFLKYDLF